MSYLMLDSEDVQKVSYCVSLWALQNYFLLPVGRSSAQCLDTLDPAQ